MTKTPAHTCVFFDDGEPELLCACGGRALALRDEGGADWLPIRLPDERAATAGVLPSFSTLSTLPRELAVSA